MYIGVPGRMVEVKCPADLRVQTNSRYSFSRTLSGAVKAQAGPVGARIWDIRFGQLSTPSDVGTLMDFANGAWGAGPFWFVSADAPVVNLLTPSASSCHPDDLVLQASAELLGTPPMDLGADGVAARSVWKTPIGTATFGPPVPVIPGTKITGAAWVVGAGWVRLTYLNAAGENIGAAHSTRVGQATPSRVAVTATVPANAVAVELAAIGLITQAARPTLTWTDQPYEWGDGQGCPKAVVHSSTRDVTKAWNHPTTGRWSDLSFTVQEVG